LWLAVYGWWFVVSGLWLALYSRGAFSDLSAAAKKLKTYNKPKRLRI
jgi:hypothetical protein